MVRAEAARALGQRGNFGSLDKLTAALNDEHTAVRDFAAAAMIRINDRNGEAGSVSTCTPSPQVIKKK
jgi:HEAT repeat protein